MQLTVVSPIKHILTSLEKSMTNSPAALPMHLWRQPQNTRSTAAMCRAMKWMQQRQADEQQLKRQIALQLAIPILYLSFRLSLWTRSEIVRDAYDLLVFAYKNCNKRQFTWYNVSSTLQPIFFAGMKTHLEWESAGPVITLDMQLFPLSRDEGSCNEPSQLMQSSVNWVGAY